MKNWKSYVYIFVNSIVAILVTDIRLYLPSTTCNVIDDLSKARYVPILVDRCETLFSLSLRLARNVFNALVQGEKRKNAR